MRKKTKEKIRKIFGYIFVITAIILVIVVFGGAYYFVIAPNLVKKPLIPKPSMPEDALSRIENGEEVINADHINYIINEIGAYKLRKPFGKKNFPVMEFVIVDTNMVFAAYVDKHMPITKRGIAKNPDIIIKGSQKTVYKIFTSSDIVAAVREAKNKGTIQVEIIADMTMLAAKGYLGIYDSIK